MTLSARYRAHRADPGTAIEALRRARVDVARRNDADRSRWFAEMGFVLAMIGVAAMGATNQNRST